VCHVSHRKNTLGFKLIIDEKNELSLLKIPSMFHDSIEMLSWISVVFGRPHLHSIAEVSC
jgi:hypothetical protein